MTIAVALVAEGALVAGAVLLTVWTYQNPLLTFDLPLALAIQGLAASPLDLLWRLLSEAGGRIPSLLMILGVATLFWVRRSRQEALFVLLTVGSFPVNQALKWLIDRPRPTADLVRVLEFASDSGYPSGHVMHFVLFFGFLFYLTWAHARNVPGRQLGGLLFLLPILAIGPSRVYLGAHWPSDVLGGYLWGLLLLVPLMAGYRWLGERARRRAAVAS